VEGCKRKFWNTHTRRCHLVERHKYPKSWKEQHNNPRKVAGEAIETSKKNNPESPMISKTSANSPNHSENSVPESNAMALDNCDTEINMKIEEKKPIHIPNSICFGRRSAAFVMPKQKVYPPRTNTSNTQRTKKQQQNRKKVDETKIPPELCNMEVTNPTDFRCDINENQ